MAQIIGGRYEVENRLGGGTYGVVVRAFDPKLRRWVAIKVLHDSVSGEAIVRARFAREAQVMAGLHHPAIVPIFDFGEEGGGFYLVMAYYAGGTLHGSLTKRLEEGRGPFFAT